MYILYVYNCSANQSEPQPIISLFTIFNDAATMRPGSQCRGELATWGIKMSESEEHLSAACRMGQTFNPTHHGLTGLNVDCDWMLAVSID